jgi:flagellar biosynthesis protein FlhG
MVLSNQDDLIQPGDQVQIKTLSPLFREAYTAEILSVQERTLQISMPMHEGKLALLGARIPLELVCLKNGFSFSSEVISRTFKPNPYLLLQLPYDLRLKSGKRPRVITVTSGKGGVGKTTFTINLAITLSQMGQRVFVIDADLGTANIDVLLNLHPPYNLTHIINKEKELLDIIVEGPGGIYVVPGGSGLQNLADMENWQFSHLINSLQMLEQYADIILIDTGAGLSKNVVNFVLAADSVIVVTTPEPHSITDAYAILKVLDEYRLSITPQLLLNRVESVREYQDVSAKMLQVADRFLKMRIHPLGYIFEDPVVPKSNRSLKPFSLEYPDSPATRCIRNIADCLLHPDKEKEQPPVQEKSFFGRIKELFNR